MAAQELVDIGEVAIEEADIVSRLAAAVVRRRRQHRRRLRRRPAGRRTPRCPAATAATRPSIPTTAAAASAPQIARLDAGAGARARLRRSSACPCPRVRPATGCWSRSATTSAGPAGCWSCPAGAAIPDREPPGRLHDPRGAARRVRSLLDRRRGRVPGVVGARAPAVRGLLGERDAAPRLRALEPPGRGRSRRRGGRLRADPRQRRLRLRRQARHPQGPARPGAGPVPADRRLRRLPRARLHPLGALHRLAHRRPRPLREGRHADHVASG